MTDDSNEDIQMANFSPIIQRQSYQNFFSEKKMQSDINKSNLSSATTRMQMTKTSYPQFKGTESRNDLSFSASEKRDLLSPHSKNRFS